MCGKCLLNILAKTHMLNIYISVIQIHFHMSLSYQQSIFAYNAPFLTSSIVIIKVAVINPNTSNRTELLLREDKPPEVPGPVLDCASLVRTLIDYRQTGHSG